MKIISLFLIISILFSYQSLVLAQTVTRYEADLLFKNQTSAEKKNIFITFEDEAMIVVGKKDKTLNRILPNSTIKIASYSYSEKPQIAEGIALTLAFGWLPGFAFFFTNKKKHWLIISTETDNFLFELKKADYRQLIFEMNTRKINIQDLGKMKKPKKS